MAFSLNKDDERGITAFVEDVKLPDAGVISVIDRLFVEKREENPYKNIAESDQFNTKVVGVTFGNRQETIAKLSEGVCLSGC